MLETKYISNMYLIFGVSNTKTAPAIKYITSKVIVCNQIHTCLPVRVLPYSIHEKYCISVASINN